MQSFGPDDFRALLAALSPAAVQVIGYVVYRDPDAPSGYSRAETVAVVRQKDEREGDWT